MGKKDKDLKNNREFILLKTMELLTQNSVQATSFADIAKAVNLSKGTLYYYFPSKEDLVLQVCENYFKEISQQLFEWLGHMESFKRPQAALQELIGIFTKSQDRAKLHISLMKEEEFGNQRLLKRWREKYAEWQTLAEVGLARLELSPLYAKKWAMACFGILDGSIINRALKMPALDLEELLKV